MTRKIGIDRGSYGLVSQEDCSGGIRVKRNVQGCEDKGKGDMDCVSDISSFFRMRSPNARNSNDLGTKHAASTKNMDTISPARHVESKNGLFGVNAAEGLIVPSRAG
jgi:hypothetical protein